MLELVGVVRAGLRVEDLHLWLRMERKYRGHEPRAVPRIDGVRLPNVRHDAVIRSFPTIDNVRDAAARGDESAKEELESAERAESRRKRAEASELMSIDQLPELGLSAPTVFVWDQEERDGDNWAVVRVAGNGLEVWRELAY